MNFFSLETPLYQLSYAVSHVLTRCFLMEKNSKHKAHFKTKLWIFHENPNDKKCTFSQLCQLWSTPVAHMLMIWTNRFWGLTSIHLKSFHLQYHGLKRNIHLGGSKKIFFVSVPGCWNNYLHIIVLSSKYFLKKFFGDR